MASIIKAHFLVFATLAVACGGEKFEPLLFGTGGAAGAPATGGAAGSVPELDAGSDADAAPAVDAEPACPEHMFQSGDVCIDEKPATLESGIQGNAVGWTSAFDTCAARGLRLCTEYERESACPDEGPARDDYCQGPANTWEWSEAQSCAATDHRISPCCTVAQGFGECNDGTKTASFRCCLTK